MNWTNNDATYALLLSAPLDYNKKEIHINVHIEVIISLELFPWL